MYIEEKIASWDGKSAAGIQQIYDTCNADNDFPDTIIALLSTDTCEKGATWLLKAWLEAGHKLDSSQITKVYGALGKLQHWEARLHVLQCIPFMIISDADCCNVHSFLMSTLTERNKFVRAWAYNGFYELSRQHAGYINETKQYFEMAMRDEAPSVKARIRNIMKKGF